VLANDTPALQAYLGPLYRQNVTFTAYLSATTLPRQMVLAMKREALYVMRSLWH